MAPNVQQRNGQAAAQQAPMRPSFAKFLALSQPINKQLSDVSFTNFGETKSVDLDRVGYLAYLFGYIEATITTGAAMAGTWDTNFFPWNLISKITAESNSGYQFYNTSGFENMMIMRTLLGLSFDPGTAIHPNTSYNGVRGARNAFAQVVNTTTNALVPAGTAIASSTVFKVRVPFVIPFVSHRDMRSGLILVQNNATRVTVRVTLGSTLDLGVTSGTATLTSCTLRTVQQVMSIPADPTAQPYAPGEGFRHRIISEQLNWTASGDQDYRVPVNGIICRVWQHFLDVTSSRFTPLPFFAAAGSFADPTSCALGNATVEYASSQRPESVRAENILFATRYQLGLDMPDGVLLYDFATGSSLEAGISIANLYNTRRLTEFKLQTNVTSTPAAGAKINYMRQELQPAA